MARFSDFLHQLFPSVFEHLLRLSLAVARWNHSGWVWGYDIGGAIGSLLDAKESPGRTLGKYDPALWCVVEVWVASAFSFGQQGPTPILTLVSAGRCSTIRARCARSTPPAVPPVAERKRRSKRTTTFGF